MTIRFLAAALALSLAAPVRAQDSADDAKKAAVLEEARQHVAKAKVHYDLGEFKEAAEEYITVYRLRPIPAILFNVAQAYRQAGLYEKARQFYKSYLREQPEAKNKAMIEQAIKEMDDLLAKERHTREAAPTGVTQPADTALPIPEKPVAQKQSKPSEVKPAEAAPAAAKRADARPDAKTAAPKPADTVALAARPTVTHEPAAQAAKPVVSTRPSAPPAATSPMRAPPQPVASDDSGSVFTKWWFWTAVGAVAVGGGVAAMSMGGNQPPGSHFGTTPVFP